mgnify:CR=1 FL=1
MSLTLEQVQRIAHLARIEISESEALSTQGQLNGIFELIEQMQAVDTQGVEPMAHAQDLSQRLRDDAGDGRCCVGYASQAFRHARQLGLKARQRSHNTTSQPVRQPRPMLWAPNLDFGSDAAQKHEPLAGSLSGLLC